MQTSESISVISAALVKAQRGITFAVKDSINPHLKNKYADLGSVIEAVKGPLNENGIAVIQLPTESSAGYVALVTRLQHESGEWIQSTALVPMAKQDAQAYGSAMTYARRYALAAAVCLYQDDDDGNKASKGAGKAGITPAGGVADALPEARRRACESAAAAVVASMQVGGPERAVEAWLGEKVTLSTDEQVAAWSMLDSKVRSAIKKTQQTQKEATNG